LPLRQQRIGPHEPASSTNLLPHPRWQRHRGLIVRGLPREGAVAAALSCMAVDQINQRQQFTSLRDRMPAGRDEGRAPLASANGWFHRLFSLGMAHPPEGD